MKINYQLIFFFTLLIYSCTNSTIKKEGKETGKVGSAQDYLNSQNKGTEVKEIESNIINDSLFEINPAGFVIGHSENPSWDVAYILFEDGRLVFTTFPPNENIYYKTGKWELKNDSLNFTMTKLVFTEGTGKKTKVKPSEKYQSGEKFENYVQKRVDTLMIESFDWKELKTLIKNEDHWEWRLEDKRAKDFSFNAFDK